MKYLLVFFPLFVLFAGFFGEPVLAPLASSEMENTRDPRPRLPENRVVAHRGGSMEKNCPDNSIEALNYAVALGCYASECDVYLTKDEKVIVAHADGKSKINGFYPWEATFEEIVSAGKLPNGETIPDLEQYLDRVMQAGTILLWIDVKSISKLSREESDELAAKCAEKASEIVHKKKAARFVEFITAREKVHKRTVKAARGKWNCGFMDPKFSPEQFKEAKFKWANFSNSAVFYHNGAEKGSYTIDDYKKKGIDVSIYHVDSEMDKDWYVQRLDKFYALTTNYPKALLDKIRESKTKK